MMSCTRINIPFNFKKLCFAIFKPSENKITVSVNTNLFRTFTSQKHSFPPQSNLLSQLNISGCSKALFRRTRLLKVDAPFTKQLLRCNCNAVNNNVTVVLKIRKSSLLSRHFASASDGQRQNRSNTTGLIYLTAVLILMIGGTYVAVPLYKVFCQATGLGGQATQGHDTTKVEHMTKVDRQIRVRFNADVASSMRWNFRPQQTEVVVAPGETALAFYTAKNPTDKPIIGISTYNVLPYDAGQYFNKIQCFCFEEQRLNPNEQVDMPVFFYIDPEFAEDPKLENVNTMTLSYTFFEAKEGLQLPLPGYPQPHDPPIPA